MAKVAIAPSSLAERVGVIAPASLGATAIAALRARGIEAALHTRADDVPATDVIAWALEALPTPAAAVELAGACTRAAAAGRPICVLAPPLRGTTRTAIERAAALSYLRAHGAALCHDVDAWLEAIVMLVRYGLPAGPRTAVIAEPGSWLEMQTQIVASELETAGTRALLVDNDEPTDVVLHDAALPPRTSVAALVVPVAPRGELAQGAALHGARAALAAIAILGRAAERIAVGLGPAPASASAELGIDAAKLERQTAKLAPYTRLGDHETKVLLSAYGVPITRQAVATTPSAAVKVARKAGFPVEVKPWGHDVPTETAGCPLEKNVTSDALVRAAFTSVLAAAGKANQDGAAVIIRESPPAGRELAASLLRLPSLGWTVVLETPGTAQIAAAPAPLRLVDAMALAAQVTSSRAGDAELDRTGLANLLRRVSHLVVDLDQHLLSLELSRIIVGGRGSRTLVVDAHTDLR